jgi:hypothetical protein
MLTIEKNIPIPTAGGRWPDCVPWTKTITDMQVGDSFFVKGLAAREVHPRLATAKKKGFKVVTRTQDGGVRVWRVA